MTKSIFSDTCERFFYSIRFRTNAFTSYRCFYLDTAENAVKNGMAVKPSKYEKDIDKK